MTYELVSKIAMTSLMFSLLFVSAIKYHGDNDPPYLIKAVEVIGLLFSGSAFFVFMLASIWV